MGTTILHSSPPSLSSKSPKRQLWLHCLCVCVTVEDLNTTTYQLLTLLTPLRLIQILLCQRITLSSLTLSPGGSTWSGTFGADWEPWPRRRRLLPRMLPPCVCWSELITRRVARQTGCSFRTFGSVEVFFSSFGSVEGR